MVIEPRGVLAVERADMFHEPVAEKLEQRLHGKRFAMVCALRGFEHLREQALMLGTVFLQAGKAIMFHQLLFAEKVHARELDELVEQIAYFFAAGAVH